MCGIFLIVYVQTFFNAILIFLKDLCLLQFDSRTAREDRTDSSVCVCVCVCVWVGVSCFMAVGGDDPIEGQLA